MLINLAVPRICALGYQVMAYQLNPLLRIARSLCPAARLAPVSLQTLAFSKENTLDWSCLGLHSALYCINNTDFAGIISGV